MLGLQDTLHRQKASLLLPTQPEFNQGVPSLQACLHVTVLRLAGLPAWRRVRSVHAMPGPGAAQAVKALSASHMSSVCRRAAGAAVAK